MATVKYNLGSVMGNNYSTEKYSTEEIAIGTWIDGKTIYRKCIVNNGSVSGSGSIPLSVDLSNVDRIIDYHGTGVFDSVYEMPIHYSDGVSYFDMYRHISERRLYFSISIGGRQTKLTNAFIFMDYTKINE